MIGQNDVWTSLGLDKWAKMPLAAHNIPKRMSFL
jgi:hypothetical protein